VSDWKPPREHAAAVSVLAKQLVKAAQRPIRNFFVSPDGKDQKACRMLAEIVATVRPHAWADNPTNALVLVVRDAIARLPQTPTKREDLTWQAMGYILYGFRTGLPPKADGNPYNYNDYTEIVRGQLSDSAGKREARELRQRLAVELIDLAANPPPEVASDPSGLISSADIDMPFDGNDNSALPSSFDSARSRTHVRRLLIATSLVVALGCTLVVVVLLAVPWAADHLAGRNSVPPSISVFVQDVESEGGWSATFDANNRQGIANALNKADYEPFPDYRFSEFLHDELKDGAYLAGAGIVKIALTDTENLPMTITALRLVNVERRPTMDGATIRLYTQGSGPDLSLGFNLDTANPVPKNVAPHTWAFGDPYFQDNHVDLVPGIPFVASILFKTSASAYSFDLAVDYVFDGRRGTQQVSSDGPPSGQPFRVTADPCFLARSTSLTPQEIDRARAFKYGAVREMWNNSTSAHEFRAVTPNDFAQECAG
jgi:hypothetical protein